MFPTSTIQTPPYTFIPILEPGTTPTSMQALQEFVHSNTYDRMTAIANILKHPVSTDPRKIGDTATAISSREKDFHGEWLAVQSMFDAADNTPCSTSDPLTEMHKSVGGLYYDLCQALLRIGHNADLHTFNYLTSEQLRRITPILLETLATRCEAAAIPVLQRLGDQGVADEIVMMSEARQQSYYWLERLERLKLVINIKDILAFKKSYPGPKELIQTVQMSPEERREKLRIVDAMIEQWIQHWDLDNDADYWESDSPSGIVAMEVTPSP